MLLVSCSETKCENNDKSQKILCLRVRNHLSLLFFLCSLAFLEGYRIVFSSVQRPVNQQLHARWHKHCAPFEHDGIQFDRGSCQLHDGDEPTLFGEGICDYRRPGIDHCLLEAWTPSVRCTEDYENSEKKPGTEQQEVDCSLSGGIVG